MRTTYPWRYVYLWWSRVCTALETVRRASVFVWERCLAWSFWRWSDSSACSARTQGARKTGPAPDESPVSVRSDNSHIMAIRFGAMSPWSQPYFMDLVRVGVFVLAYLPNPTSYGHETYTIGYSKDWGLRGCVEILWQPHQIWSYVSPWIQPCFMVLVHMCKIVFVGV